MGDVTTLPPARTPPSLRGESELEDICTDLTNAITALWIVDNETSEDNVEGARAYLINRVHEHANDLRNWWSGDSANPPSAA